MKTSPSDTYPLWARCTGCLVCIVGFPMVIAAAWSGASIDGAIVVAACLVSTRGLSTLTNRMSYNDGPIVKVFDYLLMRGGPIQNRSSVNGMDAPQPQLSRGNRRRQSPQ